MTVMQFTVYDLPPKKDGATSMWGKPLQAERLVSLRMATLEVRKEQPPLTENIRLTLTVHVGKVNNKSTGDLDNFVTGICDGLMKRVANSRLCGAVWDRPENAHVHPDEFFLIADDSQITVIHVEKVIGGAEAPWYEVTLVGE